MPPNHTSRPHRTPNGLKNQRRDRFLTVLFSSSFHHFRFPPPRRCLPLAGGEAALAVIDWSSETLCVCVCVSAADGCRNPSPTVKHNPAHSRRLKPALFHISPPLWILILKTWITSFSFTAFPPLRDHNTFFSRINLLLGSSISLSFLTLNS